MDAITNEKEILMLEALEKTNSDDLFQNIKILVSTSSMFVTFVEDDFFKGRELVINGEVIYRGFIAYVSSMKWWKPYDKEEIKPFEKEYITGLLRKRKFKTDFRIILK